MSASDKLHVNNHKSDWDMASMAKALWLISSREGMSIRSAAKVCKLSPSTVDRYWNKIPTEMKNRGIRDEQEIRDWLNEEQLQHTTKNGYPLLTTDQEHYLIKWILLTQLINYPLNADRIKMLAKEIIKIHKGIIIECLNSLQYTHASYTIL